SAVALSIAQRPPRQNRFPHAGLHVAGCRRKAVQLPRQLSLGDALPAVPKSTEPAEWRARELRWRAWPHALIRKRLTPGASPVDPHGAGVLQRETGVDVLAGAVLMPEVAADGPEGAGEWAGGSVVPEDAVVHEAAAPQLLRIVRVEERVQPHRRA